jgi:acyl carrier protein
MAEAKAHKARRVLVTVVASYDTTVVRKSAIENSEEFLEFLNKDLLSGSLDSLDIMDIEMEVENLLSISITESEYYTWQKFFEHLVKLLNEE